MFFDITDIVSSVTPIAALIAGFWGVFKGIDEYIRQGAQKRYEIVTQIQKQLNEDATLYKICSLLEMKSPNNELRDLPFSEKRKFLIFFEHVALLTNTGLIRKDVSEYLFGYYPAICLQNDDFWNGIPKEEQYWGLFLSYAHNMKKLISENKLSFNGLRF